MLPRRRRRRHGRCHTEGHLTSSPSRPLCHSPPPPLRSRRDLPQGLQDAVGGFLDEGGAFQEAFVYYADALFRELGPLVKLWMT